MPRIAIFAGCIVMLAAASAFAQSKAMIQGQDDKWAEAFNKGDAAAVAAMYTEDAYALPAGHDMVKGRAAIKPFWKETMQQLGDAKLVVDVTQLGPRAAREIGTFSFQPRPSRHSPLSGNMSSCGASSATIGCSRLTSGT